MFRMHPTNQLKMLLCACRLRRLHSRQNENSHLQPIAAASSTEKEIYKTVVCAQLEFTLLSTKSLYLSLSVQTRASCHVFARLACLSVVSFSHLHACPRNWLHGHANCSAAMQFLYFVASLKCVRSTSTTAMRLWNFEILHRICNKVIIHNSTEIRLLACMLYAVCVAAICTMRLNQLFTKVLSCCEIWGR